MTRMVKQFIAAAITSTCLAASAHAIDDASVKVKWGYKGNTGPVHWGQLSPDFSLCAKGKLQSPINITKLTKDAENTLTISYTPASLIIVDDGATDLLINGVQSIINTGHGIQLNFPSDRTKEFINFENRRYHLVQFHLHTPSENFMHGQSTPLEIHFVHQSDDGHLAVIGVFVKAGKENPALAKIVKNLPKEEAVEVEIEDESLNPEELLPAKREYYSFDGSLTTPPCSEGVRWLVMADSIEASSAQIAKLRQAMNGMNARPLQPLHGRVISLVK